MFQGVKVITFSTVKPGSHVTVMTSTVMAEVSQLEHDYGTCILSQVPHAEFNLLCGTAGTARSDLKKINLMSL